MQQLTYLANGTGEVHYELFSLHLKNVNDYVVLVEKKLNTKVHIYIN